VVKAGIEVLMDDDLLFSSRLFFVARSCL